MKKIKVDYKRYCQDKNSSKILQFLRVILYPGFVAILTFRIADYLYSWNKKMYLLSKFLMLMPRIFFGIDISVGAKIGEGFFISHGCGLVIGAYVEIGKNVTVSQQVTLGGNFGKTKYYGEKIISQPIIQDECIIAPGAKILGPVVLGKKCLVGANVVIVNKNYEENTRIIG